MNISDFVISTLRIYTSIYYIMNIIINNTLSIIIMDHYVINECRYSYL